MIRLRQGTTLVVPARSIEARASAPGGRSGSATEKIGSLVENFMPGFANSIRLFFLPLLFLVPSARAQQSPDLSALVADVCKELEKSHVKNVVVFDFIGPADYISEYGRRLADQFNAELPKSPGGIVSIDRATISGMIESNRFAPGIISDPEIAVWLAQNLHAESAIVGRFSQTEGNLQLTINLFKTKHGKMLGRLQTKIPISGSLQAIIEKNVDPDSNLKSATRGTLDPKTTLPVCVNCSNPAYTPSAEADSTQGAILMDVVVVKEGYVRDIKIVRGLPSGLTLRAVEAVKIWRLRPAHGPDGVPMGFRIVIEVAFRVS
jgi:TonB family protein